MDKLSLLLIAGITTGCIYGLVALGFNLIYNSTGIFNFAQGEYLMIGAVTAALLLEKLKFSYLAAIVLVLIVTALVAVISQLIVIRPLQKRKGSALTMIMATLAVAIMISNLTQAAVGTSQRFVPPLLGEWNLKLGSILIPSQYIAIILATILIFSLIWFINNKTVLGLALRAAGYNKSASSLMGINVGNIIFLSFFLSGVIVAAAGVLLAPITSAYSYMGMHLTVKGFIAAILGGMGNPYAAIVGGVVLGSLEMLTSGYISTSLSEIIVLAILPIILILRPSGIFGEGRGVS